jgi:zinc D-Ala-D-Ala carboxypeptidase
MPLLSPHFTLEEMIASQEAVRRGIDNTPPPDVLENLRQTCAKMEEVRTILGNRPIHVNSGFRCLALNTAIGGSATSAHMTGHAVDFICPRFGGPHAVCEALRAADLGYDQIIHEFGAWTHISFDPRLRREAKTIFNDGKGYQNGILMPVAGTSIG